MRSAITDAIRALTKAAQKVEDTAKETAKELAAEKSNADSIATVLGGDEIPNKSDRDELNRTYKKVLKKRIAARTRLQDAVREAFKANEKVQRLLIELAMK
jgi:hypothetical protein